MELAILGALLALALFFGGVTVGWTLGGVSAGEASVPGDGEDPELLRKRQAEAAENAEAFRSLMSYSADEAYQMRGNHTNH